MASPLSPFVQLDAWLHASLLPSLQFVILIQSRAGHEGRELLPGPGPAKTRNILACAIVTLTTTKFPVSRAATRRSQQSRLDCASTTALCFYLMYPSPSWHPYTINAWGTKFTS